MDFEVIILHGDREVKDDGTVKWHKMQKRSALVTYFSDAEAAKTEVLRIVKALLKQMPNIVLGG